MDPFGNDFGGIGELFNRLAGNTTSSRSVSDKSNNAFDTIPVRKGTYFVFDFSTKVVHTVLIKEGLEENSYGEEIPSGRKVLAITFKNGEEAHFILPDRFRKGKFDWTSKNGILEVFFRK